MSEPAKIVVRDHMGFPIDAPGAPVGVSAFPRGAGRATRQIELDAPTCCKCKEHDDTTIALVKKKKLLVCPHCEHRQCSMCRQKLKEKLYYNNMKHAWQTEAPPMGIRIASDEQGHPLVFATKATPRSTYVAPLVLTPADVARLHGAATMKRIRGI